jgi:predicted glycoside hydrolase/deacetylase ChbG (UPF0249 family)
MVRQPKRAKKSFTKTMQNNASKQFLILTADDFGMSPAFNAAVLAGFNEGFLTSACICANGDAFEQAIREVVPHCTGLGLGVHLNIIEGKSIRKNISRTSKLCAPDGTYRQGYGGLLACSFNRHFLEEVEADFRSQIEAVIAVTPVDHLNSHVHTHSIPGIFEVTCKLAKEYGISYVRTQHERLYRAPGQLRQARTAYSVNLIKLALLNSFTALNQSRVRHYGLKTNDYLIGVAYTGFMNEQTVESGLNALSQTPGLAEILIHPCKYEPADTIDPFRLAEFQITQNQALWQKIESRGWILTHFGRLAENANAELP